MSQEVMNELVNMSQEIIKLKDQRRELLTWARWASSRLPDEIKQSWQYEQLCATVKKAEEA